MATFNRAALRRVVGIGNSKGGVGKTSTCANVFGQMAAAGYRVLLVSMDPQDNLAEDLGYIGTEHDDQGAGMVDAVMSGRPLTPVRGVRPGLDVVPGGLALFELGPALYGRVQDGVADAQLGFAQALAPVAAEYDLVGIDLPPGEETLQQLGMAAMRWLVIMTKTDYSSRKGLLLTARRFAAVRHLNPDLELLGVGLFGVNPAATRVQREVREVLARDLAGAAPVFGTTIRHVEAVAVDCRRYGRLAHELELAAARQPEWFEELRNGAPARQLAGSAGSLAGDYRALAREMFGWLMRREAEAAGLMARTGT